jgi:hypothetical protein
LLVGTRLPPEKVFFLCARGFLSMCGSGCALGGGRLVRP